MYLVDTNIILEILLNQEKAEEAKQFIDSILHEDLSFSRFSLYSLGIILFRKKLQDTFVEISRDLFEEGGIRLIHLSPSNMTNVVGFSKQFNLDFDDAYQYACADQYELTIVSFDSDFDRTSKGRKTPQEILALKSKPETDG